MCSLRASHQEGRAKIFASLRPLAKNLSRLQAEKSPLLQAVHAVRSIRPQRILFGQSRLILLRSRGNQSGQGLAIVPGHPRRRVLLEFLCVPQQLGDIAERLDSVELAGVDHLTFASVESRE